MTMLNVNGLQALGTQAIRQRLTTSKKLQEVLGARRLIDSSEAQREATLKYLRSLLGNIYMLFTGGSRVYAGGASPAEAATYVLNYCDESHQFWSAEMPSEMGGTGSAIAAMTRAKAAGQTLVHDVAREAMIEGSAVQHDKREFRPVSVYIPDADAVMAVAANGGKRDEIVHDAAKTMVRTLFGQFPDASAMRDHQRMHKMKQQAPKIVEDVEPVPVLHPLQRVTPLPFEGK